MSTQKKNFTLCCVWGYKTLRTLVQAWHMSGCLLLWIKHLLLGVFPSKIHFHLQEMVGYDSPWAFDGNWSWHTFERLAREVRHSHTGSLVCENMLSTVHESIVIVLGRKWDVWDKTAPDQPYQSLFILRYNLQICCVLSSVSSKLSYFTGQTFLSLSVLAEE